MAVEFRLLGDIDTRIDGSPITIGYTQLQYLLTILLIEANRIVAVDRLVDRVWCDRPVPRRPRAAVQHNVTLLRTALAGADVTITWRAPGYQLGVDPDAVDLHRFRRMLDRARSAPDDEHAAGELAGALALWRGEPFGGLETDWLAPQRAALHRQRLDARLDLTDLRLRRGRQAGLAAELADWVERHPLDERLAAQYLLALCHDGQQARALAHYERLRRLLADQLGVDPGPRLRELHRQILVADPTLVPPVVRPAPAGEPAAGPVPRQLPAGPRLFAGRARELARLTAAADERVGAAMVISAIGGAGGVGKTWLALRWAHEHLRRFPDGQLHVNLRGFDPAGEPVSPDAALRGFLTALGVGSSMIPSGTEAMAALYRSLVAGRRMLVLLDNARDATQVVPLLPGSPTCTVLVTSRQRLTGLVVSHGAHPVELDVLAGHEARELLTGHLGHDRIAAEPGAAEELLDRCAGLPLAISIVGARAAVQPGLALATLAGELREPPRRLDALDTGDTSTSLRASLACSHRALPAEAAAVFGWLGLAPGPDIGTAAAAGLAGASTVDVRATLHRLQDAHLVQEHRSGRFRMHDLVRHYAAGVADRDGRCAGVPLRRLVDHYLHTAAAAALLLDPHRQPVRPDPPVPGCRPDTVADETAAMAWLADEHANLLACQGTAAAWGWHAPVWQLAWSLDTFHWRSGHLRDARATWIAALAAAEALGDVDALTRCHQRLGNACAPLGLHAEALHHLEQALVLARGTGDRADQAHTHHILAWVWEERGDDTRALEHAEHAVRLFRAVGKPAWEANALNTAGWYHARLGHHDQARTHCVDALTLFHSHVDPQGEAATLDTLGYVAHHTGQHDQARDYYQQALALFRDLGYVYEEANTLAHLGQAHRALGQHDQARSSLRQALRLYEAQSRATDTDRVRRELHLLDHTGV
jgi:DNA-binding SARP family transcriptional activator/tetratricopeptide (TPR) repeat protein